MSMTTLPEITASTTTSIPAPGRLQYDVMPERLLRIDRVDYVRCDLHGLIPLDHECSKSPLDHWCREAAHPNYDPEDRDQGVSHRQWDTTQGMKVENWRKIALEAVEALKVADLYLDGFVWVTEPEFSELRDIKRASKKVQRWVETLTKQNGLTKSQLDTLRGRVSDDT